MKKTTVIECVASIGCGVSNFVAFSRTEVLSGNSSVNVFEVFSTFLRCCVWF